MSSPLADAMQAGMEYIEPGAPEGADEAPSWPPALDLSEMATREPAPPSMIIPDWLPCGYATLLAGHGGVSKSSNALHLAACSALGEPFCGLEVKQRRVLYLSCEDRENVLHWRLRRICDYHGWDMAALSERLDILDLVGHDTLLMAPNPSTGLCTTHAYAVLRERIRTTGAELLIVDGVADAFGGNENSRSEVKKFVNALLALIPEATGAVLLIAHVNKPTAQAGGNSEGYSGSTGWHNSVRARWYLYPETERTDEGTASTGRLRLDLQKANLGRSDQSIVLGWDDNAQLFTGHLESSSEFDRRQQEQEEQQGILTAIREITAAGDYVPAAAQGPRTAHHVLSATESLPETLRGKAARRRFWRHIESLRRIGEIREGSIRRANRHTAATLELKPAQDKGAGSASDASIEYDAAPNNPTQGAPAPNASYSAGGYRGSARAQTNYRRARDGE
ncbi:hypothetical protein TspCOW1_29810 [Thiohalobacter sp. COW1]|uniref:AAA family ATPase n=1 Tax=Thiohalobacter sp. COW1 TaxID=2795687 RepID=UPI0019164B03|nr:AAA family ATPase [Thiohalobacter sp. COW1]BCO32878.1 hypothetical protein TspCOW1_29810 [Thiohalobacter sp. COW1]